MKLLFDENLSLRLAALLADVYPDSAHVHQCGLASADDASIWQYAKDNGFTIVSKDSDFQERSILRGYPPKVIWLRKQLYQRRNRESPANGCPNRVTVHPGGRRVLLDLGRSAQDQVAVWAPRRSPRHPDR